MTPEGRFILWAVGLMVAAALAVRAWELLRAKGRHRGPRRGRR